MGKAGKGGPQTPQERAIALIRTAMIEKKINQAELADAADCHEKTVQNLLSGKSVRQQTLFDVCMVLGLDYEATRATWSGEAPGGVAITAEQVSSPPMGSTGIGGDIAPVYMGAYTRAGVDHYVGSYLTLRPDFTRQGHIIAYRTDIVWDPAWPSLVFEERDRPDANYAHKGRIYIPTSSMYIHLVSLTKGAMRMVMVSQPDRAGAMRGLMTTQHKAGAMLVPVSAPVLYAARSDFRQTALGTIPPSSPAYGEFSRLLGEVTDQGYARLVPLVI